MYYDLFTRVIQLTKKALSFGIQLVINCLCLRNWELFVVKYVLKMNKGKPFKTSIKIGCMRRTSQSHDCLIRGTRNVYSQRNRVLQLLALWLYTIDRFLEKVYQRPLLVYCELLFIERAVWRTILLSLPKSYDENTAS